MSRILLLSIISCFSLTFAWSQCDPDGTAPVFDAPLPEATISVCPGDIPDPFALPATDACDGALTSAFPVDDTISTNGICNGGTITRLWTVTDAAGNSEDFTQTINVIADTEAPTSAFVVEDITEFCGDSDFQEWVNTQRTNLLAGANDDCGLENIFDDAPDRLDNCDTVLVTFTLEDACGNQTSYAANYALLDNAPPAFDNLPEDLELGCSLSLPEVPDVTATDVCSGVMEVQFQEDIRQEDGEDCNNFQVVRIWTVLDNCGNMAVDSQVISLIDTLAPTFDLPADVLLNCNEDVNDLNITGNITNLSDDCDTAPTSSFRDTIVEINGAAQLQRIWTAQDACGNSNEKIQLISINDTIAPTFVVPDDITTDCGDIADLSVTGEPSMVMDNCDNDPTVEFEDIFTAGSCESGGAIQRVWRVSDDAGNVNEQIQRISIDDDVAPIISTPAQDETINCVDTASASAAFNAWIAAMGNAVANDNCTNNENLIWSAFNTGTTEPANLSEAGCLDPELNIYRQQTVDFVVQDECGNTRTTTATFTVTDNVAPVFAYCPPDTMLTANDGGCAANFRLVPPVVIESCGTFVSNYQFSITENIESDSPNNRNVPVNTVRLSFPVNPSSNFANDDVVLEINLTNVDAEQAPEFFHVLSESGDTLGRTLNVSAQCGSSQSIFTNITATQINQWAGSNAQVTFFLEPNIVADQPGRFSINDICGGSEVTAKLTFETLSPSGVSYEYQINEGARRPFLLETPIFESLTGGTTTITYYATDCSGNTGTCSYEVNIIDNEPPSITCPNDTILTLSGTDCVVSHQLPIPNVVNDNCTTASNNLITLPSDSSDALLSFFFDPDLNDYLANDETFNFTGLTPNALNPVTLILSVRADIDNGNGFFNIFGEGGTFLGLTKIGEAGVSFGDCDNFSTTTVTISPELYNDWAADGTVTIQAISNGAIPIPPGGPGDGVNPCDPAAVDGDGDTDGQSMIFASLAFDDTEYEYYLEGATTVAPNIIQNNDPLPVIDFNVGITQVFYVVADDSNNRDTCSFNVTVLDEEMPVARCAGTTVSINPSGVDADTLQVIDLDAGSSDNCGLDSLFLTPSIFDCSFVGRDTVNVMLTVIDKSGNQSSCQAPVRIIAETPEPSYFIPPCGGDTLYLFANPPVSTGNNVYTYAWSGPEGFVSNQQNPIIPNIDDNNAGSYQVTITGITECTATGIIEVAINDIPITPDLIVPEKLCSSEDLVLMTSIAPQGVEVRYKWFSGMAPNGSPLGTTMSPSLTLAANTLATGDENYYIIVEVEGCESSPSLTQTVEIIEQPVAVVIEPNPDPICEGESIELGTFVTGAGLLYEWKGPDGYISNAQIPPVINNTTVDKDGVYTLQITRDICVSQPANVVVTVRPKPQTPTLSIRGGKCEGDEVTLRMNISNATVYRWIGPDGTRTTAINELILSDVTEAINGQWRGFVTQGGCDSDESNPLMVDIKPTPLLAISANPNPICAREDLQLSASPTLNGALYEWSGPNYSAVGQNPIVNNIRPNQAGTYSCKMTTAEGCIVERSTEVDVKESVRITGISNTAVEECLTGPTDIDLVVSVFPLDDGTYEYEWTGPNNYLSRDSTATIPNATEEDSGDYSVFITTAENCNSTTETTTVDVKNPPATPETPELIETTQPPFCEGDIITFKTTPYTGENVEYIWSTPGQGDRTTNVPTLTINNVNINDDGDYAVKVIVDGCISLLSGVVPVDINIVPEILASSNSPICEGEQLELEADFLEGAEYEWTGPGALNSSNNSPIYPNAQPNVHSGTYRVKAIVDGCSSPVASVDVEVNAIPQTPLAVNNGPVCIDAEDAALRLAVPIVSSTAGATYTWFDQSMNRIRENETGLVFTLNNFEDYGEGDFSFSVQAAINGCESEISEPTTATFNTIPVNTAYAGEDVTLCESQAIELDATAPTIGFGVWEQLAGDTVTIANPDDPETAIFDLGESGTFIFRWKLTNGACVDYSQDEITILVNPGAVADAGVDIDTCRVASLRLDADEPLVGQGKWTQSEGQSNFVTIVDIFDPNTELTGLAPGNQYFFTWEVLGGVCGESSDEVSVVVSNGFSYAGEDFNDCGDGCVNLEAEEPTSGVGKWSSPNDKINFNSDTDPTTLICDLEIGENVLIWTADNGACGDASRDTVIVNYQPLALANSDTISVAFAGITEVDVIANDNVVSPSFTVTILDTPANGELEIVGEGVFEYRADSNFGGMDGFSYELCTAGCECSIAEVFINVGGDVACGQIPSIITPNNDNVNDEFIIPCLSGDNKFPENELVIFNQWGDEVYRARDYQNDWRGTYNSEDLPDGTYYYVMNFGDGSRAVSGFFLLQR
ncbi:MAG: gliding motility-associated C-terminal domain-containing protein [Bacteroidota bacterium]